MTAGESLGVIACAKAANAEMIGWRDLVIVVSEEGKKVLELAVWTVKGTEVGHAVASWQEVCHTGSDADTRWAKNFEAVGLHGNDGAGIVLAGRISVAEICGQGTAVALNVGGEKQELTILADGKTK